MEQVLRVRAWLGPTGWTVVVAAKERGLSAQRQALNEVKTEDLGAAVETLVAGCRDLSEQAARDALPVTSS